MANLVKMFVLQPLKTSDSKVWPGKVYYEQVLIKDTNGYPYAMTMTDTFWDRDLHAVQEDTLYRRLENGESVKVKITYEIVEDNDKA